MKQNSKFQKLIIIAICNATLFSSCQNIAGNSPPLINNSPKVSNSNNGNSDTDLGKSNNSLNTNKPRINSSNRTGSSDSATQINQSVPSFPSAIPRATNSSKPTSQTGGTSDISPSSGLYSGGSSSSAGGESVISGPEGQTGTTSDIKEVATFNGKILDRNFKPVEGAIVTARSIDPGVEWVGEATETINGAFVFRNAPVGARVQITATKPGWTPRVRTEVLKSNLTGDPNANVFNFGGTGTDSIFAVQDEPEITSIKVNGKIATGEGSDTNGTPEESQSTNISGVSSANLDVEMTFSEPIYREDFENVFFIVSQDINGKKITIDNTSDDVSFIWSEEDKKVIFKTNQPVLANESGDELRYNIAFKDNFKDKENQKSNDKKIRFTASTFGDNLVFSVINGKTDSKFELKSLTSYQVSDGVNPFIFADKDHLSTFSVDVDTASYTFMRRNVKDQNRIPEPNLVRIEEYLNYFDYNYPQPINNSKFTINTELSPSFDLNENKKILRIGLQGKKIAAPNRKTANLTFVIDISGSMSYENKLDNVKESLKFLISQLRHDDKISIVLYSETAKVLLENKSKFSEQEIFQKIDSIESEYSTNIESGLTLGYQVATRNYISNGLNRVILCSDGVANSGAINSKNILQKVKGYVSEGVDLSTVGFGIETYNDQLLEQLANSGNGNYSYVDKKTEAKRIFMENLTGTLQVIARDAKIQVDFSPNVVKKYRLLGYENRAISDNDFNDDSVDAGEIGSNHNVTAIYEIELENNSEGKIGDVYLRYKDANNNQVIENSKPFYTNNLNRSFENSSDSFRLSIAVSLYAEILRNSYWAEYGNFEIVKDILDSLGNNIKNDPKVSEFIEIVERSTRLQINNNSYWYD